MYMYIIVDAITKCIHEASHFDACVQWRHIKANFLVKYVWIKNT